MYINFYIKLVERAFWRMIDVEEKHGQRFLLVPLRERRACQREFCRGEVEAEEEIRMVREMSFAEPAGVGSVWDVRERLEENFRRVETLLTTVEAGDDPKLCLAAAGEVRQHLALAEKALDTVSRAEAVREFEETVLAVLAEVSPVLRRKVMDALNEKADGQAETADVLRGDEYPVLE